MANQGRGPRVGRGRSPDLGNDTQGNEVPYPRNKMAEMRRQIAIPTETTETVQCLLPPPTDGSNGSDDTEGGTCHSFDNLFWAPQRCRADVGRMEHKWENNIKIEFPDFLGSLNPDEFIVWLNTIEQIFDYGMPQDDQLGLTRRSRRVYRSGGDRDDRGWTLLHIGARKGDLKEVKRLLDEGMDVNVAAWGGKSQGVTPLHLAAEGGHVKVMDELLDRGANIDARTKGACGWTPLHNAAKERKKQAVKYLVENGAFLPDDMNDTRFNPPLHYCPGLEWAYDELRRIQQESTSSSEACYSSES